MDTDEAAERFLASLHRSPAEHYREAEECLRTATLAQHSDMRDEEDRQLRRAQVHATLATVDPYTAAAADDAPPDSA